MPTTQAIPCGSRSPASPTSRSTRAATSGLRDLGLEALVLETHIRYLQPARFDDRLVVHARCVDVRGARFRYEYVVERDGALVADGWTSHATVDAVSFRPTRIPDWLREAISAAEGPTSPAASTG